MQLKIPSRRRGRLAPTSQFGGEFAHFPGESADITGSRSRGERFPVQALWSNAAAAGAGYCVGAGTDLPNFGGGL